MNQKNLLLRETLVFMRHMGMTEHPLYERIARNLHQNRTS